MLSFVHYQQGTLNDTVGLLMSLTDDESWETRLTTTWLLNCVLLHLQQQQGQITSQNQILALLFSLSKDPYDQVAQRGSQILKEANISQENVASLLKIMLDDLAKAPRKVEETEQTSLSLPLATLKGATVGALSHLSRQAVATKLPPFAGNELFGLVQVLLFAGDDQFSKAVVAVSGSLVSSETIDLTLTNLLPQSVSATKVCRLIYMIHFVNWSLNLKYFFLQNKQLELLLELIRCQKANAVPLNPDLFRITCLELTIPETFEHEGSDPEPLDDFRIQSQWLLDILGERVEHFQDSPEAHKVAFYLSFSRRKTTTNETPASFFFP